MTCAVHTLSLHDALPISSARPPTPIRRRTPPASSRVRRSSASSRRPPRCCASSRLASLALDRLAEQVRSEEHTSELQSRRDLVCRLLLEIKNFYKTLLLS